VPVDLTASSAAADTEPRWSPDGTKIAFDSNRSGNVDVYSMNLDGTGVTNLTASPGADTLGDWSPDSKRIVLSSTRSGNGDLYVMGTLGSPTTRLTSSPGAETHAAWSPDGSTIAYSDDSGGDNDVFEIAPDGSGVRRVTDNAQEDLVQDWQPLHDTSPPRIHALRSTGRRGHRSRFRFKISEDSGSAAVEVEFSWQTKHGETGGYTAQTYHGLRAGRVYGLGFPADALRGAPAAVRFCLSAVDPSINPSRRSCAWFRFLPKKRR
jgi:dipeptidyl aminopeptidase/acylaminoacyl peptidase